MRTSSAEMRPATPTSEQYSTFRAYLDERHADGGMADMTVLDYAMMVEDSHVTTRLVEYRLQGGDLPLNRRGEGPLVGVSLTDILGDGLSMVYSFYEPEMKERSIGTFMILDHIRRAKAMGLAYVYLGYWVEGSKKMAYKAPLPAAGAARAEGMGPRRGLGSTPDQGPDRTFNKTRPIVRGDANQQKGLVGCAT